MLLINTVVRIFVFHVILMNLLELNFEVFLKVSTLLFNKFKLRLKLSRGWSL